MVTQNEAAESIQNDTRYWESYYLMPFLLDNNILMTGREFIKRVAEVGRKRGVAVRVDAKRGKGSHAMLYYGDRKAIIPDRQKQIGPGLLAALRRQLGFDRADL